MGQTGRWVDRVIRSQLDRSNLTAERERHLLELSRMDQSPAIRQAALTELWGSHSKLVVAVASRYRRSDIELLDLVGVGHLGLRTAIDRFDLTRLETRLSSYAVGWIRWFIQDYIQRNSGPVRLPGSTGHRQLAHMSGRLIADAQKACLRESVEPTEAQLCERIGQRIGLSAHEVARSLRLIQGASVSLNRDVSPDGGLSLADTLPDEGAWAEDDIIGRLDHSKVRARIMALAEEILGERERIVFLARCMTEREEAQQLGKLALRFGVSKERIFQLEVSARNKIATALVREGYSSLMVRQKVPSVSNTTRLRRLSTTPTPPRSALEQSTAEN
jgi:RNA polymerase sigma-32 factor